MAYKLLKKIVRRERVQGGRSSEEGQALNPHPIFGFFKGLNRGRFKSFYRHFEHLTVGFTQMNGIWQKYKVWLLIWIFYTAYWLIKSIKKFKSVEVQANG